MGVSIVSKVRGFYSSAMPFWGRAKARQSALQCVLQVSVCMPTRSSHNKVMPAKRCASANDAGALGLYPCPAGYEDATKSIARSSRFVRLSTVCGVLGTRSTNEWADGHESSEYTFVERVGEVGTWLGLDKLLSQSSANSVHFSELHAT